jgi:hypothetical protein
LWFSFMSNGQKEGPGVSRVGRIGIVIVTSYLVCLSVALLYSLIALWPRSIQSALPENTKASIQQVADTITPQSNPRPSSENGPVANRSAVVSERVQQSDVSEVSFAVWRFHVGEETRLMLLVVCAGALGSLVHGLRSIYWYVGNRDLVWSWIPKYLIQPFGASVLAVVFYLVIRGGFFAANAGSEHTSPFGFMALGAMVGMFSEQAVLKLKEIAETLLSKPPAGKDAEPEKGKA